MDGAGSAGRVRICVLGPLALEVDGKALPFPTGRPGRLLAVLLLARGQVVGASRLIDQVWADELPEDARAALHTTVNRARRALGPAARLLVRRGPGYAVGIDGIGTDADLFLEASSVARRSGSPTDFDAALAWWRGPAWAEFAEDLAAAEARRLEEARVTLREDRAAALVAAGRVEEAVGDLQVLVAETPLRERPVALLMRALHAAGDVAAALAVYDQHRLRLADELGLDPSSELAALQHQVLQRKVEASPVVPASRPPAHQPPGIPAPPRLYGRETHLASIRSMLANRRCVSVVGPGGVGKTSVAAAVAVEQEPSVWWVDLARLTDPAAVRLVVADAMGARTFPGGTAEAALRRRLETAEGLLVLDNCEHVLGVCAGLVEDALAAGSGVRVLSTSRERLGVADEQVFQLPPLQLPAHQSSDGLSSMPAVALFVDRATAVAPELRTDEPTLRRVGKLVRMLDGLPLAIELAAGRLGSVTLEDLQERLGERLDLLRTGSPRTPVRHRTLAATIDWSFALLSEEEQRVFVGLSVFAGPFDLSAVDEVLGVRAADVVADLVDRSLVVRPGVSGRGRYRLLETLRAFARSRLSGEESRRLREAHARWAVGLATRAGPAMEGAEEARWSAVVEQSLSDLAAAFGWTMSVGDTASAARIVAMLQPWAYFHLRPEILAWSHQVVAAGGGDALPDVHAAASGHHWMNGRFEEARASSEAGVRAAGGAQAAAAVRSLGALGDLELALGNLAAAHAAYDRAAVAAEQAGAGADAAICACGCLLARVFGGESHDDDLARMRLLAAETDNPTATSFCLYGEGEALAGSDPKAALDRLARSVAVADSVDNRLVRGVAMTAETALAGRSGPLDGETLEQTARAVRYWFGSGNENLFLTCLRNVVPLLGRLSEHRAVVELVASLARSSPDRPSYGVEAERIDHCLAEARTELGDEFEDAWRTGSERTTTEAARAVLAALESGRGSRVRGV